MNPSLSVYLDLLRFLAALAVYIEHAGHFSRMRMPYVGHFASEAVVVFFVLSGLVVAFSADKKHAGIVDFTVARLARLWSVVLPALMLTFLADTVGQWLSMAAYTPMQPYSWFKWIASLTANALFLNQIWHLNIWPGTNGPFWSLSYEFWYYALFCMAFYFRRGIRIILVLATCTIAGPKILVALPAWCSGIVVYNLLKRRVRVRPLVGLTMWLGSFILAFLYGLSNSFETLTTLFPGALARARAEWAVNFWPETYLLAMFVALNIYGFEMINAYFSVIFTRYARLIRKIAETSFGLYLFHYPLLYLIKAILVAYGESSGSLYVCMVYMLPLLLSLALALLVEPYKLHLANGLNFVFSKIMAAKVAKAPAV